MAFALISFCTATPMGTALNLHKIFCPIPDMQMQHLPHREKEVDKWKIE